jgi:putative transcriptional regulator
MNTSLCLTNQFLIAMPGKVDGYFDKTVSYICEHNHNGAIGIIINRPLTNICLGEIFSQIGITATDEALAKRPVMFGGPVQKERGFVIHSPSRHWNATLSMSTQISLTTSQDILESMAKHEGPETSLVSLGYAGWGPGQLEQELMHNCWLTSPVNFEILFSLPFEQRWRAATELLGIDLGALVNYEGHA